MASRTFARASSRDVPWLTQPGRLGTSATMYPSSPGYKRTRLIITSLLPPFYFLSLPHRQNNARRIRCRVIDALGCFLKVSISAQLVVGQILLRVACDQREPGALDLHHDAMALLESVHDARHHVRDFRRHVRPQRHGLLEAVPEARRKWLAAQKHFITAGRRDTGCGIIRRPHAVRQAEIIGKNIYQFYDEIRICAARGDKELWFDISGDSDVCGQRIRLIDEHIRAPGRETLILGHEIARISDSLGAHLFCVSDRIPGIADVFFVNFTVLGRRRTLAASPKASFPFGSRYMNVPIDVVGDQFGTSRHSLAPVSKTFTSLIWEMSPLSFKK